MNKNNKKCLNKVKKFCQETKQGPYFICRVCHWYFFEQEEYHILTSELFCPVRSFDEKIYICDIYHKHLSRHKCHIKQSLIKWVGSYPRWVKGFKESRKNINFQENNYLKIMHARKWENL